jgi:hypothetical protein
MIRQVSHPRMLPRVEPANKARKAGLRPERRNAEKSQSRPSDQRVYFINDFFVVSNA